MKKREKKRGKEGEGEGKGEGGGRKKQGGKQLITNLCSVVVIGFDAKTRRYRYSMLDMVSYCFQLLERYECNFLFE